MTIIATRHLANCIHAKDVTQAPAMMVDALSLLYACALPIAVPFYLLHLKLETPVGLAAILNFMLISGIWLISVFLTALKDYRAVTLAFLAGMCLAIVAADATTGTWRSEPWSITPGLGRQVDHLDGAGAGDPETRPCVVPGL